jgi:hypothetical protein
MKRVIKYGAIALAALILLPLATVLVASRFSDGPIGPFAGGALRTGELVTEPVADWSVVGPKEVELELVEPARSRITGSLVYEHDLYIPCDLGFVWRRLPSAGMRGIASILWAVKHWHEDAVHDGRVVLRTGGKRYPGQAVRVTDPALLATLRSIMEEKAAAYMHTTLTDAPADPEAIWFFRIDPR